MRHIQSNLDSDALLVPLQRQLLVLREVLRDCHPLLPRPDLRQRQPHLLAHLLQPPQARTRLRGRRRGTTQPHVEEGTEEHVM